MTLRGRDRLERYIKALREVIGRLSREGLERRAREVVKTAALYLRDAEYYLETGDIETGLVCASYAEGLLDALKFMGLAEFSWPREFSERRVVVAGTFDILHPGHVWLIKEASKLGKVVVIVARDVNVERFKGHPPVNPEEQRLFMISHVKGVYKAVLGDLEDMLKPIVEEAPDVVLLGPDQRVDEAWLKAELERRGLKGVEVVRLPSRFNGFRNCSTTKIVEAAVQLYRARSLKEDLKPDDVPVSKP